jgi:hypothetical protein
LAYAAGVLVSGDQDGKIFSWSTTDPVPQAELIRGTGHKLEQSISILTSYQDIVYSATSDGELKRSERVDGHVYEYKKNLQLPGAPMVVSPGAEVIFVL